MGAPLAYFITFSTDGARLPGDPRGTMNRRQNTYATPPPDPSPSRLRAAEHTTKGQPFLLDGPDRQTAANSIREVCRYRNWLLLALHIRTNHVHAVIDANTTVSAILHDFKSYATRALSQADGRTIPRWSRHGSTRYLWTPEQVNAAIDYVINEQGHPMETYLRSPANRYE